MKKSINRVYVLGNGSQAPYGIGEIIEIVPLSHIRKISKICGEYYKSPTLRLNSKTGPKLDWYYISQDEPPILREVHD